MLWFGSAEALDKRTGDFPKILKEMAELLSAYQEMMNGWCQENEKQYQTFKSLFQKAIQVAKQQSGPGKQAELDDMTWGYEQH